MNLSTLRDKFLSFAIPVIVTASIAGSIVWIIGTTYFWDTSRLTLLLPAETNVRIQIQARLVYRDVTFFGVPYPIHLTLPWSRTQKCPETCLLERLPAGDMMITFTYKNTLQNIPVSLLPDTHGTLNLRPELEVIDILDEKIFDRFRMPAVTPTEEKYLENATYSNALQGLYLIGENGDRKIYDSQTKQTLTLPSSLTPSLVGRAQTSGMYFLYDAEKGMMLYDRYGRTSPTLLGNFDYN